MLEADHWLFSAGDHPDIDSILDLTPKMSSCKPEALVTAHCSTYH